MNGVSHITVLGGSAHHFYTEKGVEVRSLQQVLDRNFANGRGYGPTPALESMAKELFSVPADERTCLALYQAKVHAGKDLPADLPGAMKLLGYVPAMSYNANTNPHLHAEAIAVAKRFGTSPFARRYNEDGLVAPGQAFLAYSFKTSGKPIPGGFTLYIPQEFAEDVAWGKTALHERAKNRFYAQRA